MYQSYYKFVIPHYQHPIILPYFLSLPCPSYLTTVTLQQHETNPQTQQIHLKIIGIIDSDYLRFHSYSKRSLTMVIAYPPCFRVFLQSND